jgi:hypothetical protein
VYLTATSLPDYLTGRGLVDLDSIVGGDFAIIEAGRRNRNFKVHRGPRPGLFIKQVSNTATLEPVATLQREAAFYALVRARPDLGLLGRMAPRLVDYDPARLCLIVELVRDGESFAEYHHRVGGFPDSPAALLGRGMAAYHALPRETLLALAGSRVLPLQLPWILNLHPATLAPLGQFATIGPMLIEALRPHPALLRTLLALRLEWMFDSVVHGDMKWDNLLIDEADDAEPELRVVDWELVDLGDAAWDAGAALAAYIAYAMLPLAETADPVALARNRLTEMRPAIRSFWTAYAANRALGAIARAYLERCLRFAAARLALTVFEFLYGAPQMNPALVAMLQAGEAIAADPSKAASEWMGL